MALSRRICDTPRPRSGTKVIRKTDRHGLMLSVHENGSRSWIQRLSVQGRRRDLGLGRYPDIPLTVAREIAMRNWLKAREGGDPRPRVKPKPTFAEAAESCVKLRSDLTQGVRQNWRTTLAYCAFGNRPVDQITADDIVRTLKPLIQSKPTVAIKLRARIATVMQHAVAHEWRETDPTQAVAARLPKIKHKATHHKSAAPDALGAVLKGVADSQATRYVKLAIRFCALTAARVGEVTGATWKEVDLDDRTWAIPARRTKRCKVHVVPLSTAALEVLAEAAADGRNGHVVFPAPGAKEAHTGKLSRLLGQHGTTTHGLRSSFRSWCVQTGVRREVAELCLAHEIGLSETENAYIATDLLAERREVMEAWSDYLTGED